MSVQAPKKPENFDDVYGMLRDFYNNFGADDLKPSNIRTSAPTSDALGKGRQVIVEINGVPYIYYNTLAGVLYKKQMDAA